MSFKRIFPMLLLLIALLGAIALTGCNQTTHYIKWTDGGQTHTLEVKRGSSYEITELPQKEGYDFAGFFTAEVGGEMYVNKNGLSVSSYSDKTDIVLYPQFTPKQYTLMLEYGEAIHSAGLTATVNADALIALPTGLQIENRYYMNFIGWFTQPNGEGLKLGDTLGETPYFFDSTLRALCDENGKLTVYAHFEIAHYTVQFYSVDGKTLYKSATVPHGTDFMSVAPRIEENGKIVVTWSCLENGEVKKDGSIEYTMTLYAQKYGYQLTLDYASGGTPTYINVVEGEVQPIPVATRNGYTFNGWFTDGGLLVEGSYYLEGHTTLTARWTPNNYTVNFDAAGGTLAAEPMQVTFDARFTFPVPTLENHHFLGWFAANGTKLTDDKGQCVTLWQIAFNATVTARWGQVSSVQLDVGANALKVVPTLSSGPLTVWVGMEGKLPLPVAHDYIFHGWYTSADFADGTAVTDDESKLLAAWNRTDGITLYAKWTQRLPDYVYISNAADLKLISGNQKYLLVNHVSLDGGFTMIAEFSGILDGNGYSIKNWSSGAMNATYVGLIGQNSGTILNLQLQNCHISSATAGGRVLYAGLLCGINKGTLKNVRIDNCTMPSCTLGKTKTELDNTVYAGLLTGKNEGVIQQCGVINSKIYAEAKTGYEDADAYVGGITGCTTSDKAIIENCYVFNNNISGYCEGSKTKILGIETGGGRTHAYVGGIIGNANGVTMKYCIAHSNNISAVAEKGAKNHNTNYGGSLIGRRGNATLTACYSAQSDTLFGYGAVDGAAKATMTLTGLGDLSPNLWQDTINGPVIKYNWK